DDNDVIAEDKDAAIRSIEVKYIGTEDWDFQDVLDSLDRGGVGKGRARSIPNAADFLLLKIYEAAKQLESSSGRRTAVVVINDYLAWSNFDFVLSHECIDWTSPRLTSTDPEWQKFLDEFKKRYPKIETDLGVVLATLHEIRIFRLTDGFVLSE